MKKYPDIELNTNKPEAKILSKYGLTDNQLKEAFNEWKKANPDGTYEQFISEL
jgi:hypothetical protein